MLHACLGGSTCNTVHEKRKIICMSPGSYESDLDQVDMNRSTTIYRSTTPVYATLLLHV